jgi:hypothetical protein
VLHGAAVTRQGETATLSATAYSTGGAVVSQMSYGWSVTSGDTSVAVADGVLTGGASDGDWTVSAAVLDSNGSPLSITCAHSGSNFATVGANELRVLVMDQRTGGVVGGANVVVMVDGAPQVQATLPSGQALFENLTGTVGSVSVFYDTAALAADYVTMVAPDVDLGAGTGNDFAMYVFTREKGKKAGVEGSFDFVAWQLSGHRFHDAHR